MFCVTNTFIVEVIENFADFIEKSYSLLLSLQMIEKVYFFSQVF